MVPGSSEAGTATGYPSSAKLNCRLSRTLSGYTQTSSGRPSYPNAALRRPTTSKNVPVVRPRVKARPEVVSGNRGVTAPCARGHASRRADDHEHEDERARAELHHWREHGHQCESQLRDPGRVSRVRGFDPLSWRALSDSRRSSIRSKTLQRDLVSPPHRSTIGCMCRGRHPAVRPHLRVDLPEEPVCAASATGVASSSPVSSRVSCSRSVSRPCAAQAVYGSISGTVKDNTGARSAGRHGHGHERGAQHHRLGDHQRVRGSTSKDRLLPGTYEVRAELQGFKQAVRLSRQRQRRYADAGRTSRSISAR